MGNTMRISWVLLFISLIFSQQSHAETLYRAQVPTGQRAKFLLLVDGYQNCCASSMDRLKQWAMNNDFTVHRAYWNHFSVSPPGSMRNIDPDGTESFVNTAISFIRNSVPAHSDVYVVAHSFGADSILQLMGRYQFRLNVRLVALLDPVGYSGFRASTLRFRVPNNIYYLYNRWQNNVIPPIDFRLNGAFSCGASNCDQKSQNVKRTSDGKTRYTNCALHEVTCPGFQPSRTARRCVDVPSTRMEERCVNVPGTESRCVGSGIFRTCGPVPVMKNVCRNVPVLTTSQRCTDVPVGRPRAGRKQVRMTHLGMPEDAFIENSLIRLIANLNQRR